MRFLHPGNLHWFWLALIPIALWLFRRKAKRMPVSTLLFFRSLAREHQEFIEVFVRCRGNIKEVERDLGVSYPTVRARLEDTIRALGYEVTPPADEGETRKLLNDISEGRLSVDEALRQIRKR